MARRHGLLLAVPIDALNEDKLIDAMQEEGDGILGPSRSFDSDLVVEAQDGTEVQLGVRGRFMVVDFSEAVYELLRDYDPDNDNTANIKGFSLNHEGAIPSMEGLVARVKEWAASPELGRAHFYSAREEPAVPKSKAAGATPKRATRGRITNQGLMEAFEGLSAQVQLLQSQAAVSAAPAARGEGRQEAQQVAIAAAGQPPGPAVPSCGLGRRLCWSFHFNNQRSSSPREVDCRAVLRLQHFLFPDATADAQAPTHQPTSPEDRCRGESFRTIHADLHGADGWVQEPEGNRTDFLDSWTCHRRSDCWQSSYGSGAFGFVGCQFGAECSRQRRLEHSVLAGVGGRTSSAGLPGPGVHRISLWEAINPHRDLELFNDVLTAYGRELYESGRPYLHFAETLNGISQLKPSVKRNLQGAWNLAFGWVQQEPVSHHVSMPYQILLGLVVLALTWGWPAVAGCLSIGWGALLRAGEITSLVRSDILFPADVEYTMRHVLISLREPKTRFSGPRHQGAKLDFPDLVEISEFSFGSLQASQHVWPHSAQSLRSRLKQLLTGLGLQTAKDNTGKPLDLGSLRAGGATFLMDYTEDSSFVMKRGRWSHLKTMQIYVQEVTSATYMSRLDTKTKSRIIDLARQFGFVFQHARQLQAANIPSSMWFSYFRTIGR